MSGWQRMVLVAVQGTPSITILTVLAVRVILFVASLRETMVRRTVITLAMTALLGLFCLACRARSHSRSVRRVPGLDGSMISMSL